MSFGAAETSPLREAEISGNRCRQVSAAAKRSAARRLNHVLFFVVSLAVPDFIAETSDQYPFRVASEVTDAWCNHPRITCAAFSCLAAMSSFIAFISSCVTVFLESRSMGYGIAATATNGRSIFMTTLVDPFFIL
jgi:hypothetical protein